MRLLSIRLPEELDRRLATEARRLHKPRSLLAREAIDAFLASRQRAEIEDLLRKAAEHSSSDDLEIAEEALPLDNAALDITEDRKPGQAWPAKWWR
jgi:predicted transcriptional regulator